MTPWLLVLGLGLWVAVLHPSVRLGERLRAERAVWRLFPVPEQGEDPAEEAVPVDGDPARFAERYRIEADLDGDGREDRLLSEPIGQFGKSGGRWTVFLWRDGGYREIGELAAHPGAVALEPDPERILVRAEDRSHARVWVYLRGGAGQGILGYHRIGETAVGDLEGVEIGTGEDRLGGSLYEAAFRSSPIPFRRERSVTAADGVVSWVPDEAGSAGPGTSR
jgi:hypothetical protein